MRGVIFNTTQIQIAHVKVFMRIYEILLDMFYIYVSTYTEKTGSFVDLVKSNVHSEMYLIFFF